MVKDRAATDAPATIPGAKLLCLSSPYARTGVLYETFTTYWGKAGEVLVWRAPTVVMNPSIPQTFIDREQQRDPTTARAEWGAEFREDIETAFPLDIIEACMIPGRRELPPARDIEYCAFTDPSGGRSDAFTLAIGHKRPDGTAVVDVLKSWSAPFSPESVVREVCNWLQTYGVHRVTGDRYAGEWPREQFGKYGLSYEECTQPKSDLYLSLIPALTSRQVELPDHPELRQQLGRLERRKTKVGRDVIDHPTGGHDDIANVVAGVCTLVVQRREVDLW